MNHVKLVNTMLCLRLGLTEKNDDKCSGVRRVARESWWERFVIQTVATRQKPSKVALKHYVDHRFKLLNFFFLLWDNLTSI